MSEMIDGYTAQKIKDFWMAQPDMSGVAADVKILYDKIQSLEVREAKLVEALKKIADGHPEDCSIKLNTDELPCDCGAYIAESTLSSYSSEDTNGAQREEGNSVRTGSLNFQQKLESVIQSVPPEYAEVLNKRLRELLA